MYYADGCFDSVNQMSNIILLNLISVSTLQPITTGFTNAWN